VLAPNIAPGSSFDTVTRDFPAAVRSIRSTRSMAIRMS
jgi:hypothetical protein